MSDSDFLSVNLWTKWVQYCLGCLWTDGQGRSVLGMQVFSLCSRLTFLVWPWTADLRTKLWPNMEERGTKHLEWIQSGAVKPIYLSAIGLAWISLCNTSNGNLLQPTGKTHRILEDGWTKDKVDEESIGATGIGCISIYLKFVEWCVRKQSIQYGTENKEMQKKEGGRKVMEEDGVDWRGSKIYQPTSRRVGFPLRRSDLPLPLVCALPLRTNFLLLSFSCQSIYQEQCVSGSLG